MKTGYDGDIENVTVALPDDRLFARDANDP